MQTVIVIIIVCMSGVYLVKTFYDKSKGNDDCGCGCSSCSMVDACEGEGKRL